MLAGTLRYEGAPGGYISAVGAAAAARRSGAPVEMDTSGRAPRRGAVMARA